VGVSAGSHLFFVTGLRLGVVLQQRLVFLEDGACRTRVAVADALRNGSHDARSPQRHLVRHRVVVAQLQQSEQRLQRETLDDEKGRGRHGSQGERPQDQDAEAQAQDAPLAPIIQYFAIHRSDQIRKRASRGHEYSRPPADHYGLQFIIDHAQAVAKMRAQI